MEAATSSTSATVVEAKSASRGQRQWDILCAVAGLLQQVDLLQLDEDQQQCLEAADIAVNYVDNLGCRYDTKPVSRVDLSAGSKLIPDAKDCEQLVAQIEALWRRIQQSRSLLKSSSRGRHSHASRSRHRSDAVVAASASAGSSGSDGGDAFSPFASSVHMLAFCASEQKQRPVSQKTIHQSADAEAEVHGCPTIDRMATKSKSKLASSASTAYKPATASTSAASASATSPNRTTCSTASNSSSNRKRRYNSSGSESKQQRKNQFLQQQQQQEQQQEQQQQDAGPPTPELRSCQLAENDLRDGQRLLVSQADAVDGGATAGGLWYSGVLKEVQPPDVYRVSLNGSPRSRHQYFTREELLCQAVLEIRPSSTAELPAGCRVCAYWSASLTALYPGTVSSHQCHDDSEADNEAEEVDNDEEQPEAGRQLVYIEFDDNDSRWIPLDRIRMLPPGPPPQPSTCRRSPAAAPACGNSPAARRRRRSSATSAASTAAPAPPVATFEWADAGKRRGRRQRHRSLLRNGQPINVGDAVMFKSSAIDRPFYGRVTDMWEEEAGLDDEDVDDDVEDGNVGAGSDRRRMWVEAAWFYQPVEMPESLGRRFRRDQGRALFLSGHRDRNEARTILRKLPLLSFAKSVTKSSATKRPDTYFLAGEYDASSKRIIRLDPEYEAALLAREAERRQRKQQKKRLLAESSSSSSRR
ncbi:hypothetical protein BOX15_Mlig033088g3 [Macrostomum lignano]|uniref:BAH domain-containing protein n=1 Tax=Macrostomum lignano TaxID=282301 RepID=A0A267EBD9_9PLAT|nr:hypothetical protein BOX15_Mlig033088g3 [Macrostomum lignano]